MTSHGNIAIKGGFAAVFSGIFVQALEPLVNWLLAMTFVILADLASSIRKHYLLQDEPIRFSKGVRDTMGKFVTYYSFVIAFVMIEVATDHIMHIDRWACLAVCTIESFSIANNLLKPHGLQLSLQGIMKALGKKVDIDTTEIVTKDNEDVEERNERG